MLSLVRALLMSFSKFPLHRFHEQDETFPADDLHDLVGVGPDDGLRGPKLTSDCDLPDRPAGGNDFRPLSDERRRTCALRHVTHPAVPEQQFGNAENETRRKRHHAPR